MCLFIDDFIHTHGPDVIQNSHHALTKSRDNLSITCDVIVPTSESFTMFINMVPRLIALVMVMKEVGTSHVNVTRRHHNYSFVPRDINVPVTKLDLSFKSISYLDCSSFSLYMDMVELIMNRNPVSEIRADSFANNFALERFHCNNCELSQLPADFGGATKSLKMLTVKYGFKNTSALEQLQWSRFVNLKHIELWGNVINEFNSLGLPPSIKTLDIAKMGLMYFPNLTAPLFPTLKLIRSNGNNFSLTEQSLYGVSTSVHAVNLNLANVKSIKGLVSLPELRSLQMAGNKLETIEDLLGLKKLTRLYIAGNSRFKCDHRVCWRRLLKRMRPPLEREDNVTCMQPSFLSGYNLFMGCADGNNNIIFYTCRFMMKLYIVFAIVRSVISKLWYQLWSPYRTIIRTIILCGHVTRFRQNCSNVSYHKIWSLYQYPLLLLAFIMSTYNLCEEHLWTFLNIWYSNNIMHFEISSIRWYETIEITCRETPTCLGCSLSWGQLNTW